MLSMETPGTPAHILFLSTSDPGTAPGGRIAFEDVLQHVERRLPRSREFRRKLVRVPLGLDRPYWVEDADFDLEFHVREVAVPPPGSWRQLTDVVGRIHGRPLDLSRPPWELYVIEGLGDGTDGIPGHGFAVMLKIHHAAVDGIAGVEIITALHDHAPDAEGPSLADEWRPEADPSAPTLLGRAVVNTVVKPWRLVQVVRRAAPSVVRVIGESRRGELETGRPDIARTKFNGRVTAHRTLGGRRAALADVRAARALVDGASVNDVVLAAVGGALRRYLDARDELPDVPLIAVVPISTRTVDELGTGGNQVATLTTTLATDVADPVERLAAVTNGTRNLKKLSEAVGARTLTELSNAMPGLLIGVATRAQSAMWARNRGRLLANTTVSNVPGPTEPRYFCGARLVGPYLGGPVSMGTGLIHTVLSCAGEITISFVADRELLPDPAEYEQCIEDSLHELFAATAG